jgi:bifunctional UDP-N-acetylglucosamine pyrophosphorylase / glucosamine-1-phosphate N-acetyltransferase
MDHFQTDYFFDLSLFKHKELFKNERYVWDALKEISPYLNAYPLGVIDGEVSENAFLINREKISIGKGSVVEPGAYIKGPCIIGEHCVVRHGAYIRGDFISGDRCVIGHDTEVKNAIFLDGAQAAHFAYVGDSILGNQCNLGAGTKLANLKFSHGSVLIHFNEEHIDTGLRKFGAIIGDHVQIGCNSVTNPGALIGPLASCYPCLNIGGFIPAKHVVKNNFKPTAMPPIEIS